MAVKFIDSFSLYSTNPDLVLGGYTYAGGAVGVGTGRFGGNSYDLAISSSSVLGRVFPFYEYVTLSFYFYSEASTLSSGDIVHISDTPYNGYAPNNVQVGLVVGVDGAISLLGDSGAVKAISTSGVIHPQTWHHMELQVFINQVGHANLYVDGILILNVDGDFFEGTALNYVVFYGIAGGHMFDNIVYQDDATSLPPILGGHKIHTIYPNADTPQADWTGSYADIDDPIGVSDGDTTYISTSALNNKSEFSISNLTESPTTVYAIQTSTESRKTDAGTKGVTAYIKSNTSIAAGAEFAATETYGVSRAVYELNPDGSVAWDVASINALLVGVEITT